MSFHVTLPSNSSMRLYPNNTLSDFRIRLAKPLSLPVSYEVGIEEIIYPRRSYEFKADDTWVIIQEKRFIDSVKQKGIAVARKKIKVDCGTICGFSTLTWYINEALEPHNWMLTYSRSGYFTFLRTSKQMNCTLTLHPRLAVALGFTRKFQPIKIDQFATKSEHVSPMFYNASHMFIYADFVEYQHVGDTLVPLLRICLDKQDGILRSEKYIRPYYVPVVKQSIEEVHLQVRTYTGDPYPFPTGAPLICKLHFRPRK